jgi:NADH-quinone oxidoreductase subunit F
MQLPPQLETKFNEFVGRYPVKRSALIPMMVYAQDQFGFLGDEILQEIATRLGLNTIEVEETLAYYSMLRRKPAGKYHIQVCTNISCMLRGGNELYKHVQRRLGIVHKEVSPSGTFSLEEVECIGACSGAPAMQVNYDFHEELDADKVDAILEQLEAGKVPKPVPVISGALHQRDPAEIPVITKRFGIPNAKKIDTYLQNDGYKALEKALKEMTPASIIGEVKKSNLRGRGGAGFPTGMKWSFVPKDSPKPKYVLCNADESEPGTSKDRPLMELDPHQLIEGTVIAGRAIGSNQGYIYIRGEYRYLLDIMDIALAEAYAKGFLGKNILGTGFDFELCTHTGAGAYECGEESALMESLEGGDWYASLGTPKNGGTRLYSISGHVNKPGIYELPLGFPLRRMIYEVAGGMRNGKKLKAVIPGGSSCPLLSADEIDVAMDYDSVAKIGSMLGSGGTVVMDEDTCMVDVARRIMHFYAHESCGWCIPCREGTAWLQKMLDRFHEGGGREEDIPLIDDLSKNMLGRTFCALGDAAALPTISIVQKWRGEFEDHLHGKCAYNAAEMIVGAQ